MGRRRGELPTGLETRARRARSPLPRFETHGRRELRADALAEPRQFRNRASESDLGASGGGMHETATPSLAVASFDSAVEVESGADEREMGERLRIVSQVLSAGSQLLGIEAKVVSVAQHLLEQEPRLL